MAKVPPPKGKGEPPLPGQTVGNLEAPERVDLEPLNFKVPRAFRREFKTYAAQHGKSMSRVLQEAFATLKDEAPIVRNLVKSPYNLRTTPSSHLVFSEARSRAQETK